MNSDHLVAAVKTAQNAEELLAESRILLRHSCHARSYALLHLAREEMAKAQMFRELDELADIEQAAKRMRDHPTKIEKVAEVLVMGNENCEEAREILAGASATRGIFNDVKNRSLYADFYEGDFWMPSEYIPRVLVEKTLPIAEFELQNLKKALAGDKRRMGASG